MPINGTKPVVSPAVPQVTYDAYWIKNMIIMAASPNQPVSIQFDLVPLETATGNLSQDKNVRISVPDVFGLAKTNSQVNDAINAILLAAQNVAIAQGKI